MSVLILATILESVLSLVNTYVSLLYHSHQISFCSYRVQGLKIALSLPVLHMNVSCQFVIMPIKTSNQRLSSVF